MQKNMAIRDAKKDHTNIKKTQRKMISKDLQFHRISMELTESIKHTINIGESN